MAITQPNPIHWLPELKEDFELLLIMHRLGYRLDRWQDVNTYDYKYGIYKTEAPEKKEVMGVFDSPQEAMNLLRFLLATAEKEN